MKIIKNSKSNMTSRERVLCALNHQEPDRVPVELWAEPEVKEKLLKYFSMNSWDDVLDKLEIDVRTVEPIRPDFKYITPYIRQNYCGERWKHTIYGWFHTDGALQGCCNMAELERYKWPSCDDNYYDVLKQQLINAEGRAILYGFADIWQRASMVVGIENMFIQMVENPEFVHFIVNTFTNYYIEDLIRALDATNGKIDIFWMCSDLGSQIAPLISLEMFRKYLKPYIKKTFAIAKSAGVKCMYHSCGAMSIFIEDLIEAGMDILNPVQTKAFGMDPSVLKKKYGSRISFLGGMDEQEILPNGTTEDVQSEVKRLIDILGKNGGYIICSANFLQPDTSIDNILAMYDLKIRG